MKPNYQKTIYACFTGYIVQAIVNNFAPLLFLTFQKTYDIPLTKITMLITLNFGLQLVVDFISAGFIDKIGYRPALVMAHILSAIGLISLTFLPELFADPFVGLLVAVMVYAAGGGLLEVLISPTVEACPSDNKEKTMSLLHSFYCWGQVGVVLISTIYFSLFGIVNWKILALLWASIPIINTFIFTKVPIASLVDENEATFTIKALIQNKIFWILMLLMVCAGASEQAVSQWASTFAEQGLQVTKTVGDLAGPMFFAVMMGLARLIYGKYGEKINLEKFMVYSSILCVFSYLVISLSPLPILGLIGCGICGLSVGILWPGSFSIASASIKGGGTAMFAFLALAGDLGCSVGPTLVGFVSSAANNNLKTGILSGILFPVLLIFGILLMKKTPKIKA
ncbi:MFS transporter [Scatolibacter rhodanostii]|uniref:MFS transporter n=1 Tax=Scatolibacter rhodanostii TaxID=2014781 RepID=UPI000C07859D|nr:MFS transporter [Scatolibacter rhodanostii]